MKTAMGFKGCVLGVYVAGVVSGVAVSTDSGTKL